MLSLRAIPQSLPDANNIASGTQWSEASFSQKKPLAASADLRRSSAVPLRALLPINQGGRTASWAVYVRVRLDV